ncbi:hypothetical protein QY97_01255 [Bacillus thermotolerans]|uniref:Uncharacterized protein n=1 Tax=Bacillus thermotolerans TaxID=1221996 RepID=A0A0F5HSD7_BACTR|nr:hypothetical protein QY97_01255 [Bacillus thermotolerans]KKB41208.1 hypothetical protein QY95_00915 [Bacillus thermotolerans]KKB44070.1 hypothetical protein QY96_03696 [Bacillus thermotolerans]
MHFMNKMVFMKGLLFMREILSFFSEHSIMKALTRKEHSL